MQYSSPRRRSAGMISLQESLRTIGLGLDVAKVSRVELTISPQGIRVATTSTYGVRSYTWPELEAQSRAQQQHRRAQSRRAPWADPTALTRWSVLLRVVGQLLDAQGVSDCVVDAAVATPESPDSPSVQAIADDYVAVDSEAVRLQLLRLRTKYVEAREQDALGSAGRPWWAFWRRA